MASASANETSKPNIVIILADDLGYGDLGCYGGKVPTPKLDRLAADGVRFTDAHSNSAVCTPTRYGLLTGRYCWRSQLQRGVLGGLSPRLIEPDRLTIASFLKQHGYETAVFGKWHLGMNWVVKAGRSISELSIEPREQVFSVEYDQPISHGPNSVGFDHFFGISASLDMVPYTFIKNDRVVVLPTEDRDFLMTLDRPEGARTRQGPAAPGFEAADVLPTIVQQTRDFIRAQAASSRSGAPFFVYVPLAAPHTPIVPTADWQGQSGMNAYADFVMQTDAAIGEILEELAQQQLSEDTLVIVTSDNGCAPHVDFQQLAELGHLPSGPWRGHKADIFEGGHRVPLIVRWPRRVSAEQESAQLICLTDVFATIAEALDVSLPDDAAEDSLSFLPALRGESNFATRDHLVSHSVLGTFAVRRGPWKLILAPDSGGWSEPRPNAPGNEMLPPRQLYHLERDPGERQNLSESEPAKVTELYELLQQLVDRGRSTPGPRQANATTVQIETPRNQ